MSISLNATLQTAQDGQSHHVIAEIKRVEENEIPFLGQYLTANTNNETKPNCIMHSTGRICATYVYNTDNINYVYSDTARETFTSVTLNDQTDLGLGGAVTIDDCSILELDDATIGLVFVCHDGSNYYLRQTNISIVGAVASNAQIDSYAIASYPEVRSPFCILMSDGNYLLVYIVEDTTPEWTLYQRTSADFSSWSAEASPSISGISTNEKHNVSLLEIDTNDVFIFFDYENATDITNIYYSITADYGTNWGAAVAVTTYDTTDLIARHPIAIQQATTEMHIIYNEFEPTASLCEFFDLTALDANATGYTDVVYDNSQYIYIIPNYNTAISFHGLLIRYDTTADFENSGSYVLFDTETIGALYKGYVNACLVGQFLYLNVYSAASVWIIQYDTSKDFSTASSYRIYTYTAYGSSDPVGYNNIIYDNSRYLYFVPRNNFAGEHGIIRRFDTQLDFTSPDAYSTFDLETVFDNAKGFLRAVFDGYNIYFIKNSNHSGYVFKYDTRKSFTSSSSYERYDISNININAKGYISGTYDGSRYIFFVPYINDDHAYHGLIVRYDTQGDFTSQSSWSLFDASSLNSNLIGFQNACYDGKYINFVPYYNTDYDGYILRYDTSGKFLDSAMWDYVDMADSNASAVGFTAGVYSDPSHVYLAPYRKSGGYNGLFTRIKKERIYKDIRKSLYKKNLWGGASWALSYGLTNSYSVYDTTAVDANSKGFPGVASDGQYLFFSPYNNGAIHGQVTRYNTQANFTAAGSWSVYDTTAVNANSKGYFDVCYDGTQYLYFVPFYNGAAYHGLLLRYDTQADFTTAASWTAYDTAAIDAGSIGFSKAVYDGQYLYLIPYYSGAFHGQITRYNSLGDFSTASSYSFFDLTTIDASYKGFYGAVFDNNRYIYIIPNDGAGFGTVVRYDIEKSFTDSDAYAAFDITAVHADSKGFRQGCFDGRYLYLSPYYTGAAYSGQVTRYDTQSSFTSVSSWEVFDTATLNSNSKGFSYAVYDEKQYIFFIPEYNGAPFGQITRYDTHKNFDNADAWAFYDTTLVNSASKGFRAGLFLNNFLYMCPYDNGAPFGQVTRYDTTEIFSATAPEFIKDENNFDTVACLEPTTNDFVTFWTKKDNTQYSIKWEKEYETFNLSAYLARDYDIVLERTIDNKPARLTFTLASGHLFDENHISSIFNATLKKGTKITCRLGENVASTEYWQTQGTFFVKNKNVVYKRGTIPTMTVYCEDLSSIFGDMELITTQFYDAQYPERIIEDVLYSRGSIDYANISISNMTNRVPIYASWTNSKLSDILDSICDRFGHFVRIDVDNVFEVKYIDEDASTDHTYTTRDAILEYMPDNDFSDYVNRIIVQSEERLYRQVTYPEKEVQIKSGTIGWWSGTKKIKIPYSEDYSLQCINAYPVMKYLTGNFLFKGDGLRWEFTEDSSYTFGTLKLIAKSQVPQLVAALGIALATDWIPVFGGAISAAGLFEAFNILATVSDWEARIMAQPIGFVRAAVEGKADDTEFQNKIDRVVVRTIQEPLCYTDAQCQQVADHEMMVTRLQRNRITITKVGHLQDEEGDIIQVIHPISQENVKILITSITRRVRIPSRSDKTGGMYDTIEGWKL